MSEERRKQLLLDCMSMQFSVSSGDITVSYRDVVDLAIVHEEVCGERDHLVSQHGMRVAEIHAMGEEIVALKHERDKYRIAAEGTRGSVAEAERVIAAFVDEKGDV